jgi:moderate conductance mechanosensitive channel
VGTFLDLSSAVWLPSLLLQAPATGEIAAEPSWFRDLPPLARVLAVLALAALAHGLVQLLRAVGEWIVTPAGSPRLASELLARRKPKFATLTSLIVSALTFAIYFFALGVALRELTPITLGQYLATATVIGLAVGFGTQGLVQDVVTGLTLIFSDAINIGDLIETSGQTGRVERFGLRFTKLTNFAGQTILIPNRNIAVIGSFRDGYARAFLDVQIPEAADESRVVSTMERIARSARQQYSAIIIGEPRVHKVTGTGDDGWRFLRTRFRIWPGQQALIENAIRQRTIAAMKELDSTFADWMVTVTYRVERPRA